MSFNKSALNLGTGTFFAQVLSLLAVPVLTRLYSPEEFGSYNLLILIIIVLLPISTLKIETLLVTSKNNIETKELLVLSLIVPFIISILSFPFIFVIQYFYLDLAQKSFAYSILFSIVLLTLSYIAIFTQLALKVGAYKKIAISSFMQNLSTYLLQILFGFYKPLSSYLILSFTIGRLIGILPLANTIKVKTFKTKVNLSHVYFLAKKYSKLNAILILTSVLESLIYLLPSIAALYIFGIKYSGFIGLIQTLLLASVTLIGGSYSSVLFSEVAKVTGTDSYDKSLARSIVIRIFKSIGFVSLFYSILIFTAGEKIFSLIFNSDWTESASLLTWLALPFALSIIWRPITILLLLTKNWHNYLYLTLVNFVTSLIFGYLAFMFSHNWKIVTFYFFAGQSLGQIFGSIFVIKNYLKVHLK